MVDKATATPGASAYLPGGTYTAAPIVVACSTPPCHAWIEGANGFGTQVYHILLGQF